jgi:hypothetical protein
MGRRLAQVVASSLWKARGATPASERVVRTMQRTLAMPGSMFGCEADNRSMTQSSGVFDNGISGLFFRQLEISALGGLVLRAEASTFQGNLLCLASLQCHIVFLLSMGGL